MYPTASVYVLAAPLSPHLLPLALGGAAVGVVLLAVVLLSGYRR